MKNGINLYPYLPKIEIPLLLSRKSYFVYAAFVALLMFFLFCEYIQVFMAEKKLHTQDQEHLAAQAAWNNVYSASLESNTAKLYNEFLKLKKEVAEKKVLLGNVDEKTLSNVDIFADQFQALSELNIPQVQLNTITLSNEGKKVTFTGVTNNGLALIYFLRKLKSYPAYNDIYFPDLNMEDKSDDNIPYLVFTITSEEAFSNEADEPRTSSKN